jgi:restriction system protein
LIDATRRGYFRITPRGAQLLDTNPVHIDTSILEKYQEFRAFRSRRSEGNGVLQADLPMTSPPQTATPATPEATPEELFSQAYQRLRSNLEAEVLEQVKATTPAFFERLVIDLAGRHGLRRVHARDAGRAVGRSGDGGIDGIIKEDRLGLDVIYVQAKRWEGTVGRPEIQKFAGALQGQRANKGVFITTSGFSREAHEYAGIIPLKIILVGGEQLAALMVDHNVGVSPLSRFEIKRVDSDYFEGDSV